MKTSQAIQVEDMKTSQAIGQQKMKVLKELTNEIQRWKATDSLVQKWLEE